MITGDYARLNDFTSHRAECDNCGAVVFGIIRSDACLDNRLLSSQGQTNTQPSCGFAGREGGTFRRRMKSNRSLGHSLLVQDTSEHSMAKRIQFRSAHTFVPTAQWNGCAMKEVPSASAWTIAFRHLFASSGFSMVPIRSCSNCNLSPAEKVAHCGNMVNRLSPACCIRR